MIYKGMIYSSNVTWTSTSLRRWQK